MSTGATFAYVTAANIPAAEGGTSWTKQTTRLAAIGRMLAAAQAKDPERGAPVAIAVVDEWATLIAF